jgi:hypothetical protein
MGSESSSAWREEGPGSYRDGGVEKRRIRVWVRPFSQLRLARKRQSCASITYF